MATSALKAICSPAFKVDAHATSKHIHALSLTYTNAQIYKDSHTYAHPYTAIYIAANMQNVM